MIASKQGRLASYGTDRALFGVYLYTQLTPGFPTPLALRRWLMRPPPDRQ